MIMGKLKGVKIKREYRLAKKEFPEEYYLAFCDNDFSENRDIADAAVEMGCGVGDKFELEMIVRKKKWKLVAK